MKTAMKQRQGGMTFIGWMLILILIGLVAYFLLKLLPIYIDGFKVGDAVASFKSDYGIGNKSPAEIEKLLLRRLDVNMVTDVKRDDISVTKSGNMLTIEVTYDVRTNLFANVDLIVSFDKRADIPVQ